MGENKAEIINPYKYMPKGSICHFYHNCPFNDNHTFFGSSYLCISCNKTGCFDCIMHDTWEKRLRTKTFLCRACFKGQMEPNL